MKFRNYFMLSIVMALMVASAQARIWRVNPEQLADPDYTTLQAAHDAASTGDTLSVEPSFGYDDLTVTKRLVIIGPGYFLGQNPEAQANFTSAGVGNITLNSGSENTIITGLWIMGYITVNTDNIIIKRNLIQSSNSSNHKHILGAFTYNLI